MARFHLFFYVNNIPLLCVCAHVCHIFFIHSFIDSFHILTIINNAAVNMGSYISLCDCVFIFWVLKCPEVELLDHMLVIFLAFWETSMMFAQFTFPSTGHECYLFFTSSSTLAISCLFGSHPNWWEVISHFGFDLSG